MLTLNQIMDDVLEKLQSSTAFDVEEHAIPDRETVPRYADGAVKPYIAVQFGNLIPDGPASFAGSRYADYVLPVYLQVVAGKPRDSRVGANHMMDVFLGEMLPYTGQVEIRVAGAQFPMENTDGGVEAYIYPLAFGLPVQIAIED